LIHVATIIKRLDFRLALIAVAIEVERVFFLDLGGIAQHDRRQGARGGRAKDRSRVALTNQIRKVAAMIEVGVTKDDDIDVFGAKRECAVAALGFGTSALE